MQLDLLDVMAKTLAVVILVVAVTFVIMIWMAALGHPAFHIPWVESHVAT
jgi:hypothetical protein